MNIKKRITLMICLSIISIVILMVIGWQTQNETIRNISEVVDNRFLPLLDNEITPLIDNEMLPLINDDIAHLLSMEDSLKLFMQAGKDAHQAVIAEKMALVASGEEESKAADTLSIDNIAQVEERMTKGSEVFTSDEDKAIYGEFVKSLEAWKEKTRKVFEMAKEPGKLRFARKSSDTGSAFQAFGALNDNIDGLEVILENRIKTVLENIETKKAQIYTKKAGMDKSKSEVVDFAATSKAKTSSNTTLFLILGIVTGILMLVTGYIIMRSIIRQIGSVIAKLTETSHQLSNSSQQVSSASQSLAEGATEQAAGLEETSSSLEEMASMTKQNADNAQQANALSDEAKKAADSGSQAMKRMDTAINDIQKSSDETAKIIKVIDEIAFQTNLLALNAAVEAARAGEAGKGFAVVAEEVRNLAMRSAEAAKNTSEMIEESVKNAKNGVDIANEVGKTLNDIVEGIGKTSDLVGEIAAASQEQAQGIDQVNQAVSQMDKVTQSNAANAEESASASEELSSQAVQMNRVVQDLVALVGASATKTVSTSTSGSQGKKSYDRQPLSHSDQAFHHIAGSKNTTVKATEKHAIPLEDEEQFDEFND